MTIGARIVVTSFPPASSRIAPWRRHSTDVAGVARPDPGGDQLGGAVWHVAASNHRMLARSVDVYRTAADATEAAHRALMDREALEVVLVRGAGGPALGWYLRNLGEPLIACARWYSTDRDRRKSIAATVEALSGASFAAVRGHRVVELA